jgi:hypothetical protein
VGGIELFTANEATTTVSSGGTDAPAPGTQETWTVASSAMFGAAATGISQFHVADPNAPGEVIAVTNVSGAVWTVTRGAEATTPVTHTAGFTVYQVATAGFLGLPPQWYNVRSLVYGATGNGSTDDTAAIQAALTAAISAGGGTVYLPAGTYKVSSTITANLNGTAVYIAGDGRSATYIRFYGSGDCLRIYDSSTYSTRSNQGGAGIRDLAITGSSSSSSAASTGLHVGDIFQFEINVKVRNFNNYAGSIGVHFDNNYYWMEQLTGKVYADNCGTCVMFDNSANTSGSASGSFDRAVLDIFIEPGSSGDGVTLNNGAVLFDYRLGIYGNISTSTTQYAVLRITGSNGSGYSSLNAGVLYIGVELDDTVHTAPYTIYFGAPGNYIYEATGLLNFSASQAMTSSNASGTQFQFSGLIYGDTALVSQFYPGNPVTSQAITANGQTINNNGGYSIVRVTGSGGYTGLIMQAGSKSGQQLTVVNESSGSLTFAGSGSNVIDGSSDVIAQYTARAYVWDGSVSHWYRLG